MATDAGIQLLQSQASLIRSASLAKATADKTERVPDARTTLSPRGATSSAQHGVRVAQSRGRKVHLALFGFSRGAALARAFARLVARRCQRGSDGLWRITHEKAECPIRLYFMGLFDTVASVGAPMSMNNPQSIDLTSGVMDLRQALQSRHVYGSTLDDIAFAAGGAPGGGPRVRPVQWPHVLGG